MAIVDVDGQSNGTCIVSPNGYIPVVFGSGQQTVSGSGGPPAPISTPLIHEIPDGLVGNSALVASSESVFNVSGYAYGAGNLIDARTLIAQGLSAGSSTVTGDLVRRIGVQGYSFGSSNVALSMPEPIFGVAIVTAHMDIIHVPLPVCETPQVCKYFRWGHQFVDGDLTLQVTGKGGNPLGPVCISYSMYYVQKGCTPRLVGPSHKPAKTTVGHYYATGTAGECGQPGLWLIRWNYQKTFGEPAIEQDCYFYVLDSVLCPVPGDNLQRYLKYGWD